MAINLRSFIALSFAMVEKSLSLQLSRKAESGESCPRPGTPRPAFSIFEDSEPIQFPHLVPIAYLNPELARIECEESGLDLNSQMSPQDVDEVVIDCDAETPLVPDMVTDEKYRSTSFDSFMNGGENRKSVADSPNSGTVTRRKSLPASLFSRFSPRNNDTANDTTGSSGRTFAPKLSVVQMKKRISSALGVGMKRFRSMSKTGTAPCTPVAQQQEQYADETRSSSCEAA